MSLRTIALVSVSALSLLIGSAAMAQTPPATGGIVTDAAEQAAPQANDTAAPAGDEIIVTGVRASIVGALNVKRDAVQIVDSIVAEDVGKLPDNNVVEALQRVTGVQVTNRTGGEAAGISIRGLPDALTTMNGRNIFTAAGQAFALQDIPANLVKRIDVYKTRAAEQIETGIAGQIDVFTRRPFDFKGFAVSGFARGIYNEQADTYNPNVSALVSNRWEPGGKPGSAMSASSSTAAIRAPNIATWRSPPARRCRS